MTKATESHSTRSATCSTWRLGVVLLMAMNLPMLMLYAIGALGPFLVHDFGIRPARLGNVILSSFAFAAVLSLWAGPLVDRLGLRLGLRLLFLSVALSFCAIAMARGFGGLVAAAAICGIAQALANPLTNQLIAQRVAPRRRAFVVGLKQSGVQVAALFAGLVLPRLAAALDWRMAFVVVVPIALVLAVMADGVAPSGPVAQRRPFSLARPNGRLSLLIGIQLCVGVTLSAFVTFLPVFGTQEGLSAAAAGSIVAVFGAAGMASRISLTPLGARLRDESVLLFALLLIAAGAVTVTQLGRPSTHWPFWAGAIALGLSAVATNAIAMGMLVKDASLGPTTTASGLLSAGFFAGCALGPPGFGFVSNRLGGFLVGWRMLVAVLALGSVMALVLCVSRRRHAPPGQADSCTRR